MDKEEKKVPNLRFKGFTDDWEQRKLGTLMIVNSGKDYKGLNSGNIPVFGTGGYITSVDKSLSNQDAIGLGRKGTINKPYILAAPFWTVDTLFFLVNRTNVKLSFLYPLVSRINWLKYDESTGLPSLSKKSIEKVLVYTTNYNEQAKIGKIISQVKIILELQQRKLDLLKQLKKGLLQKMFADRDANQPVLRFNSFTGDWEQCKFLECLERIVDYRGRTPKKLGLSWSHKGYLALSALNVKNGWIEKNSSASHYGNQILYDKWMKDTPLYKGQVIFTTEAPMGNVAQIPDNDKYILSQRVIAFVPKKKVQDGFIASILSTDKVQARLKGLSTGGTATGISQRSLNFLQIKYPKSDEQVKISGLIMLISNFITLQQHKIDTLSNFKKFCLQKMFI